MMGICYEDDKAKEVNELIFETIYHSAMETSVELAKIDGAYSTF
jgi:ribonucleotide reductase alpha subunit